MDGKGFKTILEKGNCFLTAQQQWHIPQRHIAVQKLYVEPENENERLSLYWFQQFSQVSFGLQSLWFVLRQLELFFSFFSSKFMVGSPLRFNLWEILLKQANGQREPNPCPEFAWPRSVRNFCGCSDELLSQILMIYGSAHSSWCDIHQRIMCVFNAVLSGAFGSSRIGFQLFPFARRGFFRFSKSFIHDMYCRQLHTQLLSSPIKLEEFVG